MPPSSHTVLLVQSLTHLALLPYELLNRSIASMGDAALAVFIQKNRGPDGVFDVPVDGWDKLLKDKRDQLAERLT